METKDFLYQNNTDSILLLLLTLCFLILKKLYSSSTKYKNLPPGPFQWPLIGNIPNVMGKNPHVLVTKIAEIHGPLISLKLGSQFIVIGSSPEVASQILRVHDRELSARYAPKATPIKETDLKKFSLLWATECTPHWKSIRVLWKSELFSNKSLDLQAKMREQKIAEMVEFLSKKEGKVINLGNFVFSAVFRTLGMVCFSKNLMDLEDEDGASEMKDMIWKFMEYSTTPIIGDLFPIFDGFDPQFIKLKARKSLRKLFNVWQGEVKKRRKEYNSPVVAEKHGDFLDFMLANGFSDTQIDYMLLEIIPAGLGTLTTTLEWAMSELLNNKSAMERLSDELKSTVNHHQPIKESNVSELHYLKACIKETLRLHPPIAFLPHCAKETCEIMSHTVPKNSLVFVNLWALGHDPKTWGHDPEKFNPERFLNSNMDFKGQDFEFLPFGAGRRMCPGMPFAAREAHLILGSLVSCFEWCLPNGSKLGMEEVYGVPLRKKQPLFLVPSTKKKKG